MLLRTRRTETDHGAVGPARSRMQLAAVRDMQCARIRSGGLGAMPGGAEGPGGKGEKDGAGCKQPSWNCGGRQGRAVWVSLMNCPTVRHQLLHTGRHDLELTERTESEGQKDCLQWRQCLSTLSTRNGAGCPNGSAACRNATVWASAAAPSSPRAEQQATHLRRGPVSTLHGCHLQPLRSGPPHR